jgi:AraC-like DNA-binding protein
MKTASAIPLVSEINDLHAAAGSALRSDLPAIHVFAHDPLSAPAEKRGLRHHRRGFFQVTYATADAGGAEHDLLFAAAPEHVLTGLEFAAQRGFTAYFKTELLAHQLASPTNEFPFLCLPTALRLPLAAEDCARLQPQFARLREVFETKHPYRLRQLAALTAALLYDCRACYERQHPDAEEPALCSALICRFDDVVLQNFQTHHTVEEYAKLLHVSADHLSAEVKARTGRNARDLIAERIVIEAKHLLTYSELTVSQIAGQLGFPEPTHFTRFFKRHVDASPVDFRRGIGALKIDARKPDAPTLLEAVG